jgi:hypothetical protein
MSAVSLFGQPLTLPQINAAAAVRDYYVQPNLGTSPPVQSASGWVKTIRGAQNRQDSFYSPVTSLAAFCGACILCVGGVLSARRTSVLVAL